MLTNLEIKHIINEATRHLKNTELDIKYKSESEFSMGHGATSTSWSEYNKYLCTVQRVKEKDVKELPYGEVKTGDIKILLPKDTDLPTEESIYQIKFQGSIYTCETGVQEVVPVGNTFVYYLMVGKL